MKAKTKNQEDKIRPYEIDELAAHLCGADPDNYQEIEDKLFEKYDMSHEMFSKIVKDLFSTIDFSVSPLTQTAFVGFGNKKGRWLAKKPVDQQFIAGLIEWATEGEEIPGPGKGFSREITKMNGEVEFVIAIKKPKLSTKE